MTTFLDTNVLIYLLDPADDLHAWSVEQYSASQLRGPTIISDIVYCEFSAGMETKSKADEAITELGLGPVDN